MLQSRPGTASVVMASSNSTYSSPAPSSKARKGRRRQISISKSTPNFQNLLPVLSSPDIILEQATPVSPTRHWPSQHTNPGRSPNTRKLPPRSRSHSRSASGSSSSSSSSTSSYKQPSPPSAAPTYGRSTTTSHIASLYTLRNKSQPPLPRSLSTAHLQTFAPPFYNRPPTPLPPSPSLTSLLRPSFSATPSRPGTPDDSDADPSVSTAAGSILGTGTTESLLSTARNAQPLPRASPKVPTYEYYGFVLYLTSSLAFLIYILWSYLPSPFLHQLGIYYYPDRWWSLALPAWTVMAVVFVYVGLAGYNAEILTLGVGELGCVVDEVGVVAILDENGRLEKRFRRGRDDSLLERRSSTQWSWKDAWSEGTDAVLDVPIGGVCEVLYARD